MQFTLKEQTTQACQRLCCHTHHLACLAGNKCFQPLLLLLQYLLAKKSVLDVTKVRQVQTLKKTRHPARGSQAWTHGKRRSLAQVPAISLLCRSGSSGKVKPARLVTLRIRCSSKTGQGHSKTKASGFKTGVMGNQFRMNDGKNKIAGIKTSQGPGQGDFEESDIKREMSGIRNREIDRKNMKTEMSGTETGMFRSRTAVIGCETKARGIKTAVVESRTGVIDSRTGVIDYKTGVIGNNTGVICSKTRVSSIQTAVRSIKTETRGNKAGLSGIKREMAGIKPGASRRMAEMTVTET